MKLIKYFFLVIGKVLSELYYLIKDEGLFWWDTIIDYDEIILNIKNIINYRVYSGIIIYIIIITIIITIILTLLKIDFLIIILIYFIFKLLFHLLVNSFLNIKELLILVVEYFKLYFFDNIKLIFLLLTLYLFFLFFFGLFFIVININYLKLLYFLIILGIVISFFNSLLNGDFNKGNNKIKYISNTKKKLTLEQRRKIRYDKKRLEAFKSVKRQGIKGTKIFYKRKGIRVCGICGNTGVIRCRKCGKMSNRSKRRGKCSNVKCNGYIERIICSNCSAVESLKK